MDNTNILKPSDFRPDPIREAHVKGAMSHLCDALCDAYPAMAPAIRKGHIFRITFSNGMGLELRGGINPNFKTPVGLIKP